MRVCFVSGTVAGRVCSLILLAAAWFTEMDTKISEFFGSSRTEIKIQVCLTPKHMLFPSWSHCLSFVVVETRLQRGEQDVARGFATPTCVNSGDHALRFSFTLEWEQDDRDFFIPVQFHHKLKFR